MPSASEAIAAQVKAGPVSIDSELTEGLRDLRHDPGDFTAVVGAGVRLSELQRVVGEHGQMLALDPPGDPTLGALVATAASGPLRHRYGAPRDLVIGMELALSDGTLARSGGRVIKNVAGYDLPKLAAGSFGTLGVITEVCVRLHPKPSATATAVFETDDPDELQAMAIALARQPLEAECLDVRWHDGRGAVLARFGGSRATQRADECRPGGVLTHLDDTRCVFEDDDALWASQREHQRGDSVVRVSGLPTSLASVMQSGANVVGRAAVGTLWTDGPVDVPHPTSTAKNPFDIPPGPELDLMRRVKQKFDPPNHCNPGLFPA